MLSILIPCYNYPVYPLVENLYHQCKGLNISFEILVSEDAGKTNLDTNKKINQFENCQYIYNKTNLGRAGNINRLLKRAEFDLQLILDCDVWPKSNDFIEKYEKFSQQYEYVVSFGGIVYKENSNNQYSLRYNYGVAREAKDASIREKLPYKYLLTSNLLLKRCTQKFDGRILSYGYEDLVFSKDLMASVMKIRHIDNPVYHTNLEDNASYLEKTQTALRTLIKLEKRDILPKGETNISKIYHIFKFIFFHLFLNLMYSIFNRKMYKYLSRKGQPLWLFDLYKLLYFSKHY